MLDFNAYQKKAHSTALYPQEIGLAYVALGLAGEAGEIANKTKKVYRDHNGELTREKRTELAKELGDVLWYVAGVATELGFSLEDIASLNLKKLSARKEAGTLQGDGDNR